MKAKYYEDADLLSLRISRKSYKYAKQIGDFIVHYSDKKEPVLIEIVNAAKFLKETTSQLPKKIQEHLWKDEPSISIPHKIK